MPPELPIRLTNANVGGRMTAPDPKVQRVFLSFTVDFATSQSYILDLAGINQTGTFGGPIRALFCDNSSNPSEVEVSVEGTDQFFTVPAFAEGVFSVDANVNSVVVFTSDGGATDKVTITVYNWEKAPAVWYRYGTFNNDKATKVQGTMDEGDVIATEPDNKPVYLAGRETASGELVPIKVDAQGRLDFASSIAIGAVFGPDAVGVAPTKDPLYIATLDSAGNIADMEVTPDSSLRVHDDCDTPTVTTVAGAAASTTLKVANTARKGMIIYNDSSANLYIRFGAAVVSTSDFSLLVPAYGTYTVDFGYTGEIRGIWAAATGNARITEFA